MTYTPNDAEKNTATAIQLASVFLFFLPGLLVRYTKWWRSPYIRLWGKASMIWSTFVLIPIVMFAILSFMVHVGPLCVVVWCIHAIMAIICAFASMFNRPLGYFMITTRFCMKEMSGVYGAAVSSPHPGD